MAIVGRARLEYPRIATIFDRGTAVQTLIVVRFIFRRRHVANRFEQPACVEPVDPRERGEFDRLEMAPRSLPLNHFGLEETDDRFGKGVVIRIATGTCLAGESRDPIFRTWYFDRDFGITRRVPERDAV